MPPNPETVVALRVANAQHEALAAYRKCLRARVFPQASGTSRKAILAAQRSLLEVGSIELLAYPWRSSRLVTEENVSAAGLVTLPSTSPFLTRRQIAKALSEQFGGGDLDAFERRASRAVDAWLIHGLAQERQHRPNLKEIIGTPLLDELMRTYLVTLARAISQKVSVPAELAKPNE